MRGRGSIVLVCVGLTVGATTLPAATTVAAAAVTRPAHHVFRSWTEARAHTAAAGLRSFRSTGANPAISSATKARITFGNRAGDSLSQIKQQLGARFVSAAIDPSVGNRLVVHVTGPLADVASAALATLDANGNEVRLVQDDPKAVPLSAALSAAQQLMGKTVGGSKILSVAEDDMAAQVIVGVDRITPPVTQRFALGAGRYAVKVAPAMHTLDGGMLGHFGSSALRDAPYVAGGETLTGPVGCTSAFPATRGGARVVVTAGHCGAVGTAWLLGKATTSSLGNMLVSHWADNSGVDAAVIANNSGGSRNCIVFDATSGCKTISFQARTILTGSSVIKVGSTTGVTTGVVFNAVESFTTDGHPVTDGIGTSACAEHGDSGGVLLHDNGDGTVTPLGIASSVIGPYLAGHEADQVFDCNSPDFGSFFQNWQFACPTLGVDNCPVPSKTVTSSWALTGLGGNDKVYSNSAAGSLYSNPYIAGSGGWQGWSLTHAVPTGVVLGIPTAIVGTGREDVYARDSTGHIWTDHYLTGSGWQAWSNLGTAPASVQFASDPTVVVGATGNEDVYATDAAGYVWHDDFVTGGGGSGWQGLPTGNGNGTFVGKPSVILGFSEDPNASGANVFSYNSENIYVANSVGDIYQDTHAPGSPWGDWAVLTAPSGVSLSHPTALIGLQGAESVFAQDTTGKIWQDSFIPGSTTGWNGWTSMGAPAGVQLSQPTALIGLQGGESVFAQDNTGKIWQNSYVLGGTWLGWNSLGAPAGVSLSSPTVLVHTTAPTGESVYARNASTGAVWQNPYASGWQGWHALGTPG